jgi:hypothetical protein
MIAVPELGVLLSSMQGRRTLLVASTRMQWFRITLAREQR